MCVYLQVSRSLGILGVVVHVVVIVISRDRLCVRHRSVSFLCHSVQVNCLWGFEYSIDCKGTRQFKCYSQKLGIRNQVIMQYNMQRHCGYHVNASDRRIIIICSFRQKSLKHNYSYFSRTSNISPHANYFLKKMIS